MTKREAEMLRMLKARSFPSDEQLGQEAAVLEVERPWQQGGEKTVSKCQVCDQTAVVTINGKALCSDCSIAYNLGLNDAGTDAKVQEPGWDGFKRREWSERTD